MKVTAYDVSASTESQFPFTMDQQKVAETLRDLADQLDFGKLVAQKATFRTDAELDNYPMTHVYLRFFEKQ